MWVLLTRDDVTAQASITKCDGAQEIDFDCYERRFTELAHAAGADAALKDLARHRKRRGFVRLACHKLTHRVGRAVGKDRGIDAFLVGYPLCSSGYYHGVVEAVMKPMGRGALARADTVCESLRGRARYSADHYNCAHGMGHGYMELFRSNAFKSVGGCDALTDHWEREHCYGGVFMENLSALDNVRRPPDVRPSDPLYPCNVIGVHYKPECYDKQTTYALVINDNDFGSVFDLCSKQARGFRRACYVGVGGNAGIQSSKLIRGKRYKTTMLHELCDLGRDRTAREQCIVGALRTMLRDLADGGPRVRGLCRSYKEAGDRRTYAFCQEELAAAYRELPLQLNQRKEFHCNLSEIGAPRSRHD